MSFMAKSNHFQMSNEKKTGCLGYIGDYTTQLYRDYFISQYKDPYQAISIMECHKGLVHVSQMATTHIRHLPPLMRRFWAKGSLVCKKWISKMSTPMKSSELIPKKAMFESRYILQGPSFLVSILDLGLVLFCNETTNIT